MTVKVCASALVIGLALMVPRNATAQEAPVGFIGALGGLTFGTVTSGAAGGQVGVRVAPGVFVIGEAGYMRNVMPKEIRDGLDDIVEFVELEVGAGLDFRASLPSTYGFGGIRWSPEGASVAPFLEGGVGFGHIKLKIDEAEVLGVDFSELIEDEFDDEDVSATKFLLALGGGLRAQIVGSVAADLGFRYTRIATEDPAINSSMIYGAVRVGF